MELIKIGHCVIYNTIYESLSDHLTNDNVNYKEKSPLVGQLEPICEQLLVVNKGK